MKNEKFWCPCGTDYIFFRQKTPQLFIIHHLFGPVAFLQQALFA